MQTEAAIDPHEIIRRQAEEIARLKEEVAWFKKQIFGRKGERLVDIVAAQPELELSLPTEPEPAPSPEKTEVQAHERKSKKRQPKRFEIPDDLQVEETVLDVPEEDRICLETGKPLVKIRDEVSDKLAYRPGYFFIKRTIRPLYVSPDAPDDGVTVAQLPPQPLTNSRVDVSVLVAVLVMKFVDHLPLYRIQRIFRRSEIAIDRGTLSSWVMQLGTLLCPLADLMRSEILSGERLFTDSTGLRYIASGPGCEKGVIWVYCGGPGGGKDPPYLVYDFSLDGTHEQTLKYLRSFRGLLHADAHGAYQTSAVRSDVQWQVCLAHARRKFTDLQSGDIACRKQVIEDFGLLFKAEREVWKLQTAGERLAYRQTHCKPIIDQLLATITERVEQGTLLPKSKFRDALMYMYKRKEHVRTFLSDGNAVIENNLAERTIKPLVLGRKNWMFLGSASAGLPTAAILSVVQTCVHLKIDPCAYLTDILPRIKTHPPDRLAELLPDRWQQAR